MHKNLNLELDFQKVPTVGGAYPSHRNGPPPPPLHCNNNKHWELELDVNLNFITYQKPGFSTPKSKNVPPSPFT